MDQAEYYEKLNKHISTGHYEPIESIQGIDYYYDGSDMCFIAAVDHKAKLAIETDFFEMDDFYDISPELESDYKIVNDNGVLCCNFERSNPNG